MADIGTRFTDKRQQELEKRLRRIYSDAAKDIEAKMQDFNQRHKVKEAKYRQMLKDGKITQADFDSWMRGQVFQGKQWQAKKDQITETLYQSNRIAARMVQGETVGVFAHNANFMSYDLEHTAGVNFGFGIYDSATVTRLIKSQPDLLPKPSVRRSKDKQWNSRKLTEQITQGVIQGESLDKIAKRMAQAVSVQDWKFMRTYARTAMTGAQNAGRQLSLENAKSIGINVKKQWMATLDGHTRTEHRMLDGQKVETDQPFKAGGYTIMYPGDPKAHPAMVYGCRCTLVGDLEDYPSEYKRYDNIEGKPIKNMTYQEWYDAKKQADVPAASTTGGSITDIFASAMQGASNAAEFWMNMDADQMEAFNASGQNIYDLYNQLRDSIPVEMFELPEWKPNAPGGVSSYRLAYDYSSSSIDVSQIPARSEGWMAGAETTGIINVREGGFDDWQYVIGHEAGHQLANYNPELQRTIVDNPGGLLGRYNQKRGFFDGAFGEYNAEEAWADAVSSYVNSPRHFQEQYPELYDALDGFFKSSPSARDFIDRTYAAYRRVVGL